MSLQIASSVFQQYAESFTGLKSAAALEVQLEGINNDPYLSRLRISVIHPKTLEDILNNKEKLDDFFKKPEKYTFSLPEMDTVSEFISLLQENFDTGPKQPYRLYLEEYPDKSTTLVAYTLNGKCIGRGPDEDSLFKEAYQRVQERVRSAIDSFFKNFKHWTSMKESLQTLRFVR